MKLLYIPPLGGGIRDLFEAGQHRRLIENYLPAYRERFDEILVLSFFDESASNYPDVAFPPQVTILPNRHRLHRYLYSVLAPWLHRERLQGVSVIRVSQATGALPAFFFKLFLRVPVAMTYGYRYPLFAQSRGWLAVALARLHEAIGRLVTDRWITTTQELVDFLRTGFGVSSERIWLIPNGVDQKRFPAFSRSERKPTEFRLIAVGRLEPQKDYPRLLRLLAERKPGASPLVTLTVVGDGSQRAALEREARERGLSSVRFLGSVEQSKLAGLFADADLYVTTTRIEGHPKSLLEAMASGLPVLAFEAEGVTPTLQNAGLPLARTDTEFLSLLEVYTKDHELLRRRGEAAATFVGSHYELSALLKRETSLLAELAGDSQ